MARILILDSGPLGTICQNPSRPEALLLWNWIWSETTDGSRIVIPEVADY